MFIDISFDQGNGKNRQFHVCLIQFMDLDSQEITVDCIPVVVPRSAPVGLPASAHVCGAHHLKRFSNQVAPLTTVENFSVVPRSDPVGLPAWAHVPVCGAHLLERLANQVALLTTVENFSIYTWDNSVIFPIRFPLMLPSEISIERAMDESESMDESKSN